VNLISKLQKLKFYRIQLSKKHFTSYQRKDGQAEVKLLRKYVVCRCPDMEAADSLRDALNYALLQGRIQLMNICGRWNAT